jgi:hypothetical protein
LRIRDGLVSAKLSEPLAVKGVLVMHEYPVSNTLRNVPAEHQRLVYRDQFRGLFNEEFQSWFERLARALHPIGEFQAIRKTRGDGGLDGIAVNAQLVYQVFAPARIRGSPGRRDCNQD